MKYVYVATAASMFRGLAYAPVWIYSAIYIHSYLGISYFLDGFIFTIGGIISMALQFYSGFLADRIPAKRLILVSYLSVSFLFGLSAAVPQVRTSDTIYPGWIVTMMAVNGMQA